MDKINRRELFKTLAVGAIAGREVSAQETKKPHELKAQELETRAGKLLAGYKTATESVKSSGVSKEAIAQMKQKAPAWFLRDLEADFESVVSIEKFVGNLEKHVVPAIKDIKSRNLENATNPALDAVSGLLSTLDGEIKELEELFDMIAKSIPGRWDANSIEKKLADPKAVVISGFGSNTGKVRNVLNDFPPALVRTFDNIKVGEETGITGNRGYSGNPSDNGNGRSVLTLNNTETALKEVFKNQLTTNFDWDRVDGLSAKERFEWIREAVEVQAKSSLTDPQLEVRLQNFYKRNLEQDVKEGHQTEQQAQAVLMASRLSGFTHTVALRLLTDANFSQQYPAEAAFTKKWLDIIGKKKIRLNFVEKN